MRSDLIWTHGEKVVTKPGRYPVAFTALRVRVVTPGARVVTLSGARKLIRRNHANVRVYPVPFPFSRLDNCITCKRQPKMLLK